MIITKPREWKRLTDAIDSLGARKLFLTGCGQCATTVETGGEKEVLAAKAMLEAAGIEVTGWIVGEVACHLGDIRLTMRKHKEAIEQADAVVVFACGAGVQAVADYVDVAVLPGLESVFLGNVVRHGVFEERCQMCGDCVLDLTAGICPVTTCPKGILNGPCGGMWENKCEVLSDRECVHVRIIERLSRQQREAVAVLPPKDFSQKLKPGSIISRARREAKAPQTGDLG